MTDLKHDNVSIESRMKRWSRFLQPDADPGFLFLVRVPSELGAGPELWPENAEARVEHIWRAYNESVRRSKVIHDDTVPSLNMFTGTEIFAEAMGCDVHRVENSLPFALAKISSATDVASLKVPELSSSSLAYLFDMADELRRRAGPEAVFKLVDVQSPMDIAALVWEKSSLFMAMIESPEAVKELASKAHELLTAFFDEWFARYGKSFVAHYPDYFMPSGISVSEDEIGNVNPEMFDEFFLPHLVEISNRYGDMGIHCCADARHQWPGFLKVPNLRLLNLVKPPARPDDYIKDAYGFFGDRLCHMHLGWLPEADYENIPGLMPEGLRYVLSFEAENEEEAATMADKLSELPGRYA